MTGFYDIEWDNCYQINFLQTYKSQLLINRFFYLSPEPYVGALASVADAWDTHHLSVFEPIQMTTCVYDHIIVQELFGERQSYDKVLTGRNGSMASGQGLPAFFGAHYQLIPFNTRVRKGRKTFGGISEAMVEGDLVDSNYQDEIAAVGLLLNDAFTAEGQDFLPSLLSPANTKHATDVITQITTGVFVGWSTQSSRKIGRGA